MAKKDDNYFEMFVTSAEYSCASAAKLLDLLKDYTDVENKVTEMHKTEHEADIHFQKIFEQLNKSFITPIEREDIFLLANDLDNVTDAIEGVACRFLMFDIQTVRDEAIEFVEIIVKSCDVLKIALTEFNKFKKSNLIAQKISEVNSYEEEGDRLYQKIMRDLFKSCKDPIELLKWRDIYEKMESCLDECRNTVKALDGIIMKNT